eukprot:gb/GECH01011760.1/.p1 GENE.gb/GECH01011760.1/~~gb/GECH01011760.1/.p1  ORF type:complete len:149 (+),score=36.92 gb/GECH01011760.1/:1-447(+)
MTKTIINFYRERDEYGCFSNFADYPIELDDKEWPTTEHYFQAMKFTDPQEVELVRKAPSPREAKRLGSRRLSCFRSDWEEVKEDIMYKCCLAKFQQHVSIRKILKSTGDAKLVEHTRNDKYWGDGGDGSGRNRLGITLMKVRDELKDQ